MAPIIIRNYTVVHQYKFAGFGITIGLARLKARRTRLLYRNLLCVYVAEMSTDYSDFDPVDYLRMRFTKEGSSEMLASKFETLDFIHRFCEEYSEFWDSSEAVAVEVAGGPSILNLICIAPHVERVVFSDLVPTCLEQVELWKQKSPNAFNWTPFFEYAVKECAGNPTGDAASEVSRREDDLRGKLSQKCTCDLTQDPIISPEEVPEGGFHLLTISGAFEVIARDEEDFFSMLRKCNNLLREGGYMVGVIHAKQSWYKVTPQEEKTLYALPINAEMVQRGLAQSGFVVQRFSQYGARKAEFSPIREIYRFVAKKESQKTHE